MEDGTNKNTQLSSLATVIAKRRRLLSVTHISIPPAVSGAQQAIANNPESKPKAPVKVMVEGELDLLLAVDIVLSNTDLLKNVFSCLDIPDICRSAAVCKLWRTVSDADDFWTRVSFENRIVSKEQVSRICSRHRNIQHLSLSGVPLSSADEIFFQDILPKLTMLTTLEFAREQLSDPVLFIISEHLPNLQKLSMYEVTVGRAAPAEAILSHPRVVEVEMTHCRTARLAIRCANLRKLSLRGSHVSMLNPTCPVLETLDMGHCSKISDISLRTALTRLPSTTSLNLEANVPLSDDSLREFAFHLTSLVHLNISCCVGVTLNGVRDFTSLRTLIMIGCESLSPNTVTPALESCINLEEVYMDNCGLLTSISLSMPKLQVLSLRGCRCLTQLDVKCRRLRQLLLGPYEPGGVGCGALRRVDLASDAITTLTWQQFPSLESVVLECPNLEELNFFDCDMLCDSVFDVLCDRLVNSYTGVDGEVATSISTRIGGCPKLQHLRLESCEGLRNVCLRHNQLQTLSLNGCKRLDSVDLVSPALTTLILEECGDLERAILKPVGVSKLALGACSNLTALELWSTYLTSLDLKGCGRLKSLQLNCPRLHHLDATFCSELRDEGFAMALACNPPLEKLVLSVCCQLGHSGLSALSELQQLKVLDMSYTDVQDLSTVFKSCPSLTSLNISSCRSLSAASLLSILPEYGNTLPVLKELDVSYCRLTPVVVSNLLRSCKRLEVVAMNGCEGVTEEIWSRKNANEQVLAEEAANKLTSLGLVRCSNLRSLCLGLKPASGIVKVYQPKQYPYADKGDTLGRDEYNWLPCNTCFSGMRALRLGLSGVQVLALALPALVQLDVSSCSQLRVLELRCPLLLTLYMQACKSLSPRPIIALLGHCTSLETMDVQHMNLVHDDAQEIRKNSQSIRNLLCCSSCCPICFN